MATTDSLEKRIDTNRKNGMEPQEIINFLKNDENVQELGKRLTQECKDILYFRFNQRNLKFYNAILNTTINDYNFQEKIRNKIKKGIGGLTKTDVFLLYLQCTVAAIISEKSYNIPTITKSNDIYTRYGGQTLLRYIRTSYNNPRYEFWKGRPKPEQRTPPKTKISYEAPKKKVELPTDIDFYTHGESNTYMPREFKKLDTWAQQNFLSEYNKEKQGSTKRNRYKNGIENYVQYDLYIFSLKKYQEFIEKKHNEIIKQIYGSTQIYNEQQQLAQQYFANISILEEDFPDIQKIIKKLSEYNNELGKIQKKHLGKTNEETLQKKYNEYVSEVEKKGIEMGIKDINESFKKEPENQEEAVKFFENISKIEEFQTEQEKIRNKYGKSIDNYENYMKAKSDSIKKYGKNNLRKWIEKYKKYIKEVENCKVQNFDIGKYQEYTKKMQNTGLMKHYENLRILYDNIIIKDGNVPKNFPIQGIKDDYESMKAKQAETDTRWENLKNKSIILYQICNIGARGLNALRSSTIGTGAKLGALILSPLYDDDERIALWEKTEIGFWNLHFNMSSSQSKSVYEDGKITLNRDNGPGAIADSIVNMYTLIYGGGAIKQGIVKGAGKAGVTLGTKGINTAGKIGLFSSGFLQQVGTTFQEGFNAGMTGNQALLYCTLSALIQGGLELVSPNEVLLGSGKNLAKSYVKELLKSGEKGSIKAIGKLFLKNMGSEVVEENLQESLQLAAGNLINMWANNQFDLGQIAGTEKLDADRNPKNFFATAIITTLTTGLVTGKSYAMQTPGIGNNQNREQLIQYIQNNNEIRSDVMNVIDKAIAGKVKIPNVNIQEIQKLKLILSESINTTGEEIAVPSGKFKAPNETFAETDESFREIVTKNPEKIRELNEIQDIDEFIKQSFEFIKGKMGLNPDIKLKITDKGNYYSLEENTVYVSRNRAGHELKDIIGKGDKAEIFGCIAHELNHYLQRKEFILNYDYDSEYRNGLIDILAKYPHANENIEYIINNYPDNVGLQEAFEKAKTYGENRENYVEPIEDKNQTVINDKEYKSQPVEEESFRRGDLVVEEFRRVIYFNGKSHQFEVTEIQAHSNSENIDMILKEINEENKSEKLEELRKEITEQYEKSTGEKIELSDEQLLSILDAHEQDGKLGELTIGQLRVKVEILSEAITDPNIRRFLLEAGFCGSTIKKMLYNNSQNYQQPQNITEYNKIQCSTMTQQEILLFSRNLDRELARLQPKNRIDIGNGIILYTTNKIIGENAGREYIIGYIISKHNIIHIRQFYRSKSEGCWRTCPGMRKEDGNISKGEFIPDYSYETTTKIDLKLGQIFDNLKTTYYDNFPRYGKYYEFSPISYIANLYKKDYILEDEMGPQNIYIRMLFPNLASYNKKGIRHCSASDYYSRKKGHNIQEVIKGYNKLVPKGLDYKHMKINPNKSYSYHHDYLGLVNVQVCTINRNGISLDFHFSRAINSPDKVWIENVVTSDAQINSLGVYNKQINAGPLTAKPIEYGHQCPNGENIDQILPKVSSDYRDIRNLYQGNPIIKRFKKISK